MKRILSLVAITVIIMLLIPASVSASYGTCLQCGSTNTYKRWDVTGGGTKTWDHCWYEDRIIYRACSNCGYQSFVDTERVGPYHSKVTKIWGALAVYTHGAGTVPNAVIQLFRGYSVPGRHVVFSHGRIVS